MKMLFRLLTLLLLLPGCQETPALTFSSEEFTEAFLDICKTETCSSVTIDYPIASGDAFISEKINSSINTYIIKALFLGDDDQPSATSIAEAAKDFILAYRDHQPDIPTDIDYGGYEAEVTIYPSFQKEQLISLEATFYLFTGGAHGYGATSFINFDSATGEEIKIEDLLSNTADFQEFVEDKFREAHKIPLDESINATGFGFEDDTFALPETIGFENKHLVFIYNAYEIASYADGPIILEIPLNEVQPFFDTTLL